LFQHHDHAQFEVFCYAQVPSPDAMTRRLQQHADHWRTIVGLSDEQVASQIRLDGIDILVDLTLHMASNRLLVFARKPAPVQVTYLAYCGSSGMSAIDYRISDPYLDPPGSDLSCYSEETVRLPRTYWCYQPGASPAPAPAPALKNGFITFGCLNNFAKVSPVALDLWATILVAVPKSRLIIHASPGAHLNDIARRMERAGVEASRVLFIGKQPWAAYMQTYAEIDIALDPFPYAGGITTCDALWMGVPAVTLSGETAVGRGGRSILSNLGLMELIAFSPDQYARIAIDLAQDRDRITDLRDRMQDRMLASPLMDAPRFARDMEAAYRQMWHKEEK
jgi:predicted O-linked N-acetylglucosamine transferase (SPINDLY family)